MKRRVLFVANGHGENAIAARIARELAGDCATALFPLVGEGAGHPGVAVVGPRRSMPSGGLVAMFNVRAFARDVAAGFVRLFAAQVAWLFREASRYDAVVAVGDAFGLALALLARRPTVFVGTAKSVYVAPYGPFERVLLRRARRAFVRDAATAAALRARRTAACAAGNVIVDLLDDAPAARSGPWIGLLPGSRMEAYRDAVRLAHVVRALATLQPGASALCSCAPTLDVSGFQQALAADGWVVLPGIDAETAFEASAGDARLIGWRGNLGGLLRASVAVVGQAGTANEQAAALGLPVFALGELRVGADWYRMRQRRLLGDALAILPAEPAAAAAALAEALANGSQLSRMRAAGPERMGAAGGARAIAQAIREIVR